MGARLRTSRLLRTLRLLGARLGLHARDASRARQRPPGARRAVPAVQLGQLNGTCFFCQRYDAGSRSLLGLWRDGVLG
jgi:hypothetical protein